VRKHEVDIRCKCEVHPERKSATTHPDMSCSSNIFPCMSLWVGDAFDRVEAEGGVGTCCGFDPTDPRWFPGPPRRDKRALCLSAVVVVVDTEEESGCSSLEDMTGDGGESWYCSGCC
jgi:hypothetical protein